MKIKLFNAVLILFASIAIAMTTGCGADTCCERIDSIRTQMLEVKKIAHKGSQAEIIATELLRQIDVAPANQQETRAMLEGLKLATEH